MSEPQVNKTNTIKGEEWEEDMDPKKVRVLRALEAALGIVSTACEAAGISRVTFYKWKKEDEKFAEAVDELEDIGLDFAETALFNQIKEGVPVSTIFYLKTKGRKRGYTEKTEVTHTGTIQNVNLSKDEYLELAQNDPTEAVRLYREKIRGN